MKTIFLGTPAIAVPFLEILNQKTEITAVITNPDQPAGRGYEVKAPPVKDAAQKLGLTVLQPHSLKESLNLGQPDLGIVVAYGKLLPPEFLKIPKYGFLNVHFSLLPKYRGAAPMQWALIHGESETGVTLFWLDKGMDTGPIFLQKKMTIGSDDAESLRQRLVILGVEALADAIRRIEAGDILREPQVGPASHAPPLTKEDGKIDWNKSADSIVQLIRGTMPWPGAFTLLKSVDGKLTRLKILRAEAILDEKAAEAGTIVRVVSGQGFDVRCSVGLLKVLDVQPEGKKPMPAWSFWQGARLKIGDKLG